MSRGWRAHRRVDLPAQHLSHWRLHYRHFAEPRGGGARCGRPQEEELRPVFNFSDYSAIIPITDTIREDS
jgi:hypothetical protein